MGPDPEACRRGGGLTRWDALEGGGDLCATFLKNGGADDP
jgi:hypothetical protein